MKFLKSNHSILHLMLIPGVIVVFIFRYIPMAGVIMAFQDFLPGKGLFGRQEWVGLDNFIYLFTLPDSKTVLFNTLYIASLKIVFSFAVPIVFAILINEVYNRHIKKAVQTIIYLPHFLSWVVVSGVMIDILSPKTGIVNQLLELIGIEPIFFLGNNFWFPIILVISDVWKGFGYGTIIYLAAITSIDSALYEAAEIDGANRWHKIRYITIPGMTMVIVLIGVLKLGQVLNAGFDQVFNLYSPIVYRSGDIIDTFVYRLGIVQAQFSVATAAGLLKGIISCSLVALSYYLADKYADYRLF
jgi:putative aldouronate transport system permease protein